MTFAKITAVSCIASCALGLELKPDSASLAMPETFTSANPLDTITVYNPSPSPLTIDTVSIRFLNGDASDFSMGKNCNPADSLHFGCYLYGGWLYGPTTMALGYKQDSLFFLCGRKGAVRYAVPARDSLKFVVYRIVNCPVCGRMPSFPAATRYLFTFVCASGERASFLLKFNPKTGVTAARGVRGEKQADGIAVTLTLQGQKIQKQTSSGMIVRGRKAWCGFRGSVVMLPGD